MKYYKLVQVVLGAAIGVMLVFVAILGLQVVELQKEIQHQEVHEKPEIPIKHQEASIGW